MITIYKKAENILNDFYSLAHVEHWMIGKIQRTTTELPVGDIVESSIAIILLFTIYHVHNFVLLLFQTARKQTINLPRNTNIDDVFQQAKDMISSLKI